MSWGDYTVTISLPPHKRGDRWEAVGGFGPILINGVTPDGALSRVRMQFRKGASVFTLDSTSGGDRDAALTISNAATWVVAAVVVSPFLPAAGKWSWDAEFYETGKTGPLTLYKGILEVVEDTTKD